MEKEYRAVRVSLLFAVVIIILVFILIIIIGDNEAKVLSVIINLVMVLVSLTLFLPFNNYRKDGRIVPRSGFDERDIIFSRWLLKDGTPEYHDYYKSRPEFKKVDDQNRSRPGLLSEESLKFDIASFYSADASFFTVGALKQVVDGEVSSTIRNIDSKNLTVFLKQLAKKMGAVDSGVTILKDYHKYSVVGRGDDYGKPVDLNHKFAMVFAVEMDSELIGCAPYGPVVLESSKVYLDTGVIAVHIAELIRKMGYSARAHIDGNYRVICPLVARDAGLGEIGRMGLLMTPKLGPRVRLSVVTTDIDLILDNRPVENSVREFCSICKKCADNCPTRAISFDEEKVVNGVLKWQVSHSTCFSFWTVNGTDCGRCISVCPYSHPNNILHNFVRWGIRNNILFRKLALKLDDLFYGRKPEIKKIPEWLRFDSAQ